MDTRSTQTRRTALVLAGGLGLGAYQAGAYERLLAEQALNVDWVAAASVGAVNAAIIAGNPPERRVQRLREFWSAPNFWQMRDGMWEAAGLRHTENWLSAIQTRLFGVIGHFHPRAPTFPFEDFKSLYDLAPLRLTVQRLVDFGRLNSGQLRLTIACTDIETGETVYIDTSRQQLTVDHLMASCGLLPEFAPVKLEGRWLGDGGLSANAPVEPILTSSESRLVFILDLFARDGSRPRSLTGAIERKNDLMFGNQTVRLLEFWSASSQPSTTSRVIYLSYRGPANEADSEKMFDVSARTVAERWQAGLLDMEAGVREASSSNLKRLVVVRRT